MVTERERSRSGELRVPTQLEGCGRAVRLTFLGIALSQPDCRRTKEEERVTGLIFLLAEAERSITYHACARSMCYGGSDIPGMFAKRREEIAGSWRDSLEDFGEDGSGVHDAAIGEGIRVYDRECGCLVLV